MPTDKSRDDQAARLRDLKQGPHPVRVIAVTSGKGGVGKTNVSVNLATAMAAAGKRTMLLDADLGLANVDVLLGLQPTYNLQHVLSGDCSLNEVILTTAGGLKVVPAASGTQRMAELSPAEHAGLIRAFSDLSDDLDVLVVDTAAGIADSVMSFARASQEVVVVVCDEPASITDAYALIKVMSRDHGVSRFQILANMTRSAAEGQALYRKLSRVTERFLDVNLHYLGAVPHDEFLRKAVQKQAPVVDAFPRSKSAQAFKILAGKADTWNVPTGPRGHLEFFVERLLGSPAVAEAV